MPQILYGEPLKVQPLMVDVAGKLKGERKRQRGNHKVTWRRKEKMKN